MYEITTVLKEDVSVLRYFRVTLCVSSVLSKDVSGLSYFELSYV